MDDLIRIGDYVAFRKFKNKIELAHYKNKIFQVFEYDNKKRLYKIKQIYPKRKIPDSIKKEQEYIDVTDRYNQWDASRLVKLKMGVYLYG